MIITLPFEYVVITGVGQCAVDAINANSPDNLLNRVCLHVPGQIAWDDCQCGSFTQTAGPWLWSENGRTPTELFGDENHCRTAFTGIAVTAEVLRCVPGVDDDGNSPSCEALAFASQQLHADAVAMRRGIVCCLENMRVAGEIEAWGVVSHNAIGPEGGCAGSQLVYRFWLPNCDCLT